MTESSKSRPFIGLGSRTEQIQRAFKNYRRTRQAPVYNPTSPEASAKTALKSKVRAEHKRSLARINHYRELLDPQKWMNFIQTRTKDNPDEYPCQ